MFVAVSLVKVCLEFIMACGLRKSGHIDLPWQLGGVVRHSYDLPLLICL